jgi:outer membrane protein OmpA-like peptidoglycan-associated protein
MNTQNVKTAQLIISGIIHLEEYGGAYGKITRLSASVVEIGTGQIAAHSEALIAEANLAFEPTQLYRDSPMYLKDKRVQAQIETAQAPVGGTADKEYIDTLFTSALLSEAENVYNSGDYAQAAELFGKVAQRDDGKVMKTYSGLYECHRKLNHKDAAEEAFSSLAGLGIENKNLSMKFLFETGQTDFVKDADMRSEYAIWLRQLAKQIAASDKCMQIIGHASKTGTKEYNDKLSMERAKEIQRQLGQSGHGKDRHGRGGKAQDGPKKTDAIGRGFAECKKCTGNDAVDTYDRRVEFKVLDCGGV